MGWAKSGAKSSELTFLPILEQYGGRKPSDQLCRDQLYMPDETGSANDFWWFKWGPQLLERLAYHSVAWFRSQLIFLTVPNDGGLNEA